MNVGKANPERSRGFLERCATLARLSSPAPDASGLREGLVGRPNLGGFFFFWFHMLLFCEGARHWWVSWCHCTSSTPDVWFVSKLGGLNLAEWLKHPRCFLVSRASKALACPCKDAMPGRQQRAFTQPWLLTRCSINWACGGGGGGQFRKTSTLNLPNLQWYTPCISAKHHRLKMV